MSPSSLYHGIVDEDLVRGILRTYQDILEDELGIYISEIDKDITEERAVRELCDTEIECVRCGKALTENEIDSYMGIDELLL